MNELYEELETPEGERKIFRIAKARDKATKDLSQCLVYKVQFMAGCVSVVVVCERLEPECWPNRKFAYLLIFFSSGFSHHRGGGGAPEWYSSSSFPHLFPLLCGVDVSYETPPFSTVLRVLP